MYAHKKMDMPDIYIFFSKFTKLIVNTNSVQGCFLLEGTLLPNYTFHHCIQTFHCVIVIQCDYHPVAIVRNLQAIFHKDTSNICYGISVQYANCYIFLCPTSVYVTTKTCTAIL